MSRCWVVVPMYNEATVVGSVIQELLQTFPNVVCVDDGSSDDSAAMARKAGAVVVVHPVNLGQGAALQTGFEYAVQDPAADAIITFDADGQHRVQDAVAMLNRVRDGEADVVLGSRFLDGRGDVSALKRLVLRTAAVQSRLSTGYRLTDAHNGLRAMSAETARKIHLTQNRMAHASELIHQLSALEARVVEQPVHIVYTEYSKSKGQSLLNGVNILADLFFR
ncbi:glycosyltransferase family 2 protein [Arthrobacter sp. NPDC089319]|uniref:glycosyltransferase family 2 protein n=1 Tax=Arthrobacter sp. NPDC089319 TaxID=3155915 RepID=UPI003442234A